MYSGAFAGAARHRNTAMTTPQTTPHPAAAEFLPKLWTVLREGYGAKDLRADALAGLTVAIVALPLSMAIAIGGLPSSVW